MKIFDKLKYDINQYVILTKTRSFKNGVTINEGTEVKIVDKSFFKKTYSIVYNGEIYDGYTELDFIPGQDENRYIK